MYSGIKVKIFSLYTIQKFSSAFCISKFQSIVITISAAILGMLPIGIFDPLNRQIRMCIANALCFCADHNDDIIDTNRIQGLDDR